MYIHENPNEGYGRTERESINSFLSQKRKPKDAEWIKTLHLTYSYGMNDKVADETTTKKDELIGSKFLSLKRKYPLSSGNRHVKTNVIFGKKNLT